MEKQQPCVSASQSDSQCSVRPRYTLQFMAALPQCQNLHIRLSDEDTRELIQTKDVTIELHVVSGYLKNCSRAFRLRLCLQRRTPSSRHRSGQHAFTHPKRRPAKSSRASQSISSSVFVPPFVASSSPTRIPTRHSPSMPSQFTQGCTSMNSLTESFPAPRNISPAPPG